MAHSFWKLGKLLGLPSDLEWAPETDFIPRGICPEDPEHLIWDRTEPLSVLIPRKRIYDIQWGYPGECIVTDRVLRVLQREGISGYEPRRVCARMKVREVDPDPCDEEPGVSAEDAARTAIPSLWELRVTGWGGVLPPDTGVRLLSMCPGCALTKWTAWTSGGFRIDESQWDGSDFFKCFPAPGYIVVSDRVRKLIEAYNWDGGRCIDLAEVKIITPSQTIGARLADMMSDDLARSRGEAIGLYRPRPISDDPTFVRAWHEQIVRMNSKWMYAKQIGQPPPDQDFRAAYEEFRRRWSDARTHP